MTINAYVTQLHFDPYPTPTTRVADLEIENWEDNDAGMLFVFGYCDRTLDLPSPFTVSASPMPTPAVEFVDVVPIKPDDGDRPAGYWMAWRFTVGPDGDYMPGATIDIEVDPAFAPGLGSSWGYMLVRWFSDTGETPVPASYQIYGAGFYSGPGHAPFPSNRDATKVETHLSNAMAISMVFGWDPTDLLEPNAVGIASVETWSEIGAGGHGGIDWRALRRFIPTPTTPGFLDESPLWVIQDTFYPGFDLTYAFAQVEGDPPDPDPDPTFGQAIIV